jgi:hypothetical protein
LASSGVQGEEISSKSFKITLKTSVLSSTCYQALCLNDLVRCSKTSYQGLWREKFAPSESENKAFAIIKEISQTQNGDTPSSLKQAKLFAACMESENVVELERSFRNILTPYDAYRFRASIELLAKKLKDWHVTQEQPITNAFGKSVTKIFAEKKISETIEKFISFYKSQLPPVSNEARYSLR